MNKAIIIGRLTRDPQITHTQTQQGEELTIARFTIAVDRRGKDAGADYIRCVEFGKAADFAEKYLRQGTKMAITGRIQTGSYTNRDGAKVYTTEVVVEEQEFAESKKSQEESQETTPEEPRESAEGFMNIPDSNDLPFKKH